MSLVVHVLEMKSKCKLVVGCFWPTAKETRVSKGHFALAFTLLAYPSQKKSKRNVKALYSERPWSLYCVYRWIHANIPLGEHDIMLIWHIFQLLALLVEICNSSSAVCKQPGKYYITLRYIDFRQSDSYILNTRLTSVPTVLFFTWFNFFIYTICRLNGVGWSWLLQHNILHLSNECPVYHNKAFTALHCFKQLQEHLLIRIFSRMRCWSVSATLVLMN